MAETREGWTQSYDGTSIWYRSVGKGIPIICLNGLGCSTFYFSYIEDYFKRFMQVVTWDYRGHGKSEPPRVEGNHTIKSLTEDLKTVMKKLKIRRAIFIGHSMGTQILYEYYKNNQKHCLALISCFGTFEKPMDTFFNSPLSKYIFKFIYIFNHAFPRLSNIIGILAVKNPLWFQVGGLLKIMKPYLVDRKILEQYVDHITKVDPIFLTNLTKEIQEHTAEKSLKKIRIPTLIIGGEDDTFTPVWISKKTHHLIPGSELFIIKKGSHVALIEQPELINLRIEKFIEEKILKSRHARKKIRTRKIAKIRFIKKSFPKRRRA